jgi:hypothetical protein
MRKNKDKPRKPHFRDALRDFYEKKTGENFDSLNHFQRSQWMTRFYTSKILSILNPGLVPSDDQDLEDSLADGPSDAGVDFLYRADGHVIIIQAKYRKKGSTEEEGEFASFCEVLTRLHPKSGSTYKISDRVRILADDIDWENDNFDLHFITLGNPTTNMRSRENAAEIRHPSVDDIQDRVDIALYDEPQLNEKLREALSTSQLISEPIEIQMVPGADCLPWLVHKNSEGREAYIGMIRAGQLRNLWRYRHKLFALNIRNYVGDTSTNKGIINTALTEPESFYFFNNGISAVSTKVEPIPDRSVLRCNNFSIVNGAQTVRSLIKAHVKNAAATGNVTVLIRISEVDIKPNSEEIAFLDQITKFNNTQNSIKIADFRSNDAVQRALSREFSAISLGGKTFKYKNKRDAERNPREISINMEEFAKTIHAFRFGSIDFYGGTSYLFDLKRGYVKVFGDGETAWEVLDKKQFQLLAGTWFLCEYVRRKIDKIKNDIIKTHEEDEDMDDTDRSSTINAIRGGLERRWIIYFAVGELLRAKYRREKKNLDEDLYRLSKPAWINDDEKSPCPEITKIVQAACEMVIKIYRSSSAQASFAHRNWFRNEETRKKIQDEVRLSTPILSALSALR